MSKLTLRVLPGLMLAVSGLASASSFQSLEQNASGLGVAYAGSAAVAEDASTVFYNPAGLTQLNGIQLSTGLVGARSSVKFSDKGSSLVGSDGGDAGQGLALPNLYVSTRLLPDLYFGFGVSRPFALSTEYDAGWRGQQLALKAELKTVNYNPAVAYRLNDKVSLGFGLNYQKLDLDLSAVGSSFRSQDSAAGWNAGALFTLSPAMRVGVSYRSAIKFKLEDQGLSTELKVPDTFTLSVWQQVSDRWEAMGDLSMTNWSAVRADRLSATDNLDYRDSWRFAWGAAYKASDVTKLKFGLAYDRSPTRGKSNHVAYAPDSDRLWLSVGGQWSAGSMGRFDLGYSYLMATRDAQLTQNGNTLRGEYEIGQHLLGLQYSVGF